MDCSKPFSTNAARIAADLVEGVPGVLRLPLRDGEGVAGGGWVVASSGSESDMAWVGPWVVSVTCALSTREVSTGRGPPSLLVPPGGGRVV